MGVGGRGERENSNVTYAVWEGLGGVRERGGGEEQRDRLSYLYQATGGT